MEFEWKKDLEWFIYDKTKDEKIIKHENKYLIEYYEITNKFIHRFAQYGCSIQLKLAWNNMKKNIVSESRLPFVNGYQCGVSCEIVKNGKVVCYDLNDGEVDYYEMSSFWDITNINRFFWKLEVMFISYIDANEVNEELNKFIEILEAL